MADESKPKMILGRSASASASASEPPPIFEPPKDATCGMVSFGVSNVVDMFVADMIDATLLQYPEILLRNLHAPRDKENHVALVASDSGVVRLMRLREIVKNGLPDDFKITLEERAINLLERSCASMEFELQSRKRQLVEALGATSDAVRRKRAHRDFELALAKAKRTGANDELVTFLQRCVEVHGETA